jgi:hypothetical protein
VATGNFLLMSRIFDLLNLAHREDVRSDDGLTMATETMQRTSSDNLAELLCSQLANKEGVDTTMSFQLSLSFS